MLRRTAGKNEKGSVIVIVAAAMAAFLSMAALSIDLGMVYLSAGQLQKSIDAAVFSSGRLLPVAVDDISSQNVIKESAISYSMLNGFENLTYENIVLGGEVSGYFTDIRIESSEVVETNFARIFGIYDLDFSRSAKAKLSPVKKVVGVAPLGVKKTELEARFDTGDLTHVVLKYGMGDGTQSFFGALDLDGQGGGANDYRLWLAHGYPGELCIGDVLLQESGSMTGPTYQGFDTRYSACTHFDALTGGLGCISDQYDPECARIVKVAVYSPGENSTAIIEGFAAFLLEEQTDDGYIRGSFLNMITEGSTTGENLIESSYFGLSNLMLVE